MKGSLGSHWLGMVLASLVLTALAWGETLEMVTYYPAPAVATMSFDRLHASRITVGNEYRPAKVPDVPDGQLLVFDRVGIGTEAPMGPLHVVGVDDTVSSVVFMPGADTGAAGRPDIRLGIGTTNPSSLLDIRHPENAAYLRVAGTGDADNFAGIDLGTKVTTFYDRIWQLAHKQGGLGAPNDFQVSYFDGTSWAPFLAIRPTGEVGVGTTAPQSPLHVARNAPITRLLVENTGLGGVRHDAQISLDSTDFNPGAFWSVGSGASAAIAGATDSFYVYKENGNAGTKLVINDAGDAGLGTALPQTPAPNAQAGNLDVNDVWLRSGNAGAGIWLSQAAGARVFSAELGANVSFSGNSWTNLISLPVTSTGRPMLIIGKAWIQTGTILSYPTDGLRIVRIDPGGGQTQRDASFYTYGAANGTGWSTTLAVMQVETLAAGNYTYRLQAESNSPAGQAHTAHSNNTILTVIEF